MLDLTFSLPSPAEDDDVGLLVGRGQRRLYPIPLSVHDLQQSEPRPHGRFQRLLAQQHL